MHVGNVVVLKIGGHTVFKGAEISEATFRAYLKVIREASAERKLVCVVGGGDFARAYIRALRSVGATEGVCDLIGIEASRLNARLFALALRDIAYPEIPRTVDDVLKALSTEARVVFVGGFQPGQSTTAVSCVVADTVGAERLIITTNVDGLYDKDPRKFRDAKLLKRVKASDLRRIFASTEKMAGTYAMFDEVSLTILERAKFRTHIVNGNDPRNIVRVLKGEEVGTEIVPG